MNNTTTKTVLKLGDKITAEYHGAKAVGIIEGFTGGWLMLILTEAMDLGFRVEPAGGKIGIDPRDRHTVKLVEAGPALAPADVYSAPVEIGGGAWLKIKAAS